MTSIVILAYNQWQLTKTCIESIYKHTNQKKTPFEVIVFNNGSSDETKDYLDSIAKKYRNIKIMHSEKNLGFPKGNNVAAKEAKGDYIVLLNNDTIVTLGWLKKLLKTANSDPKTGVVSCFTNNSSGYQKVQNVPDVFTIPQSDEICANVYKNNLLKKKTVDHIVFFCALIPRKVWDEVGGLDEDFTPGNFEDNYFCFKAQELGYNLLLSPCYITHVGSASFKKDKESSERYDSLLARNQRIYMEKTGQKKTVSLCMIVGDFEPASMLSQCIESIYKWVDEINIIFNYKDKPSQKDFDFLKNACYCSMTAEDKPDLKFKYEKWTTFSDMRNKSFDMANGDFILWMDADDVALNPISIKQYIIQNPDYDGFKCVIESPTHYGSVENIIHNRLLRNDEKYRFINDVHEDISYSMINAGAKTMKTDIYIKHIGNLDKERVDEHNKRNLAMLTKEYEEKKDAPLSEDGSKSLRYFHLVNSLILTEDKDNYDKAIEMIDECFDKCELEDRDPLTPKMWVLRGHCCYNLEALEPAQSDFLKAWGNWKHPDAGINLASIYMSKKEYDKALPLLEEMYNIESFEITNIPIDMLAIEKKMLEYLATCYLENLHQVKKKFSKENKDKDIEKAQGFIESAEKVINQYLQLEKNNLVMIDKLLHIYKITGRIREAIDGTFLAVEQFDKYDLGWAFLGESMIMNQRYKVAELYLAKCLEINPNFEIAKKNLESLEKMKSGV